LLAQSTRAPLRPPHIGPSIVQIIRLDLATALKAEGLYTEAKRILHKSIPDARRALGAEHDLTLNFRKMYADCLCLDSSPSRGDVAEAVAIYEDVHRARGVCSATGIQVGMTFHDVWTLRE